MTQLLNKKYYLYKKFLIKELLLNDKGKNDAFILLQCKSFWAGIRNFGIFSLPPPNYLPHRTRQNQADIYQGLWMTFGYIIFIYIITRFWTYFLSL